MYRKVMWSGVAGKTAGLVFTSAQIDELGKGDFFGAMSRFWPVTEALKMSRCYISPEFSTWEEAFAFSFDQ